VKKHQKITKLMRTNIVKYVNQNIVRHQKVIDKVSLYPNVHRIVLCLINNDKNMDNKSLADKIWEEADKLVEFVVDTLFNQESYNKELQEILGALETSGFSLYINANKLYGKNNKRNPYGEDVDLSFLDKCFVVQNDFDDFASVYV
jgi:hypothetical protein